MVSTEFGVNRVGSDGFPCRRGVQCVSAVLSILRKSCGRSVRGVFRLEGRFFRLGSFSSFLEAVVFFVCVCSGRPGVLGGCLVRMRSFVLSVSRVGELPRGAGPVLITDLLRAVALRFLGRGSLVGTSRCLGLTFSLTRGRPGRDVGTVACCLTTVVRGRSRSSGRARLICLGGTLGRVRFNRPSILGKLVLCRLTGVRRVGSDC